ncbi:MAG: type II toxin-antitoxin system HicB family antitoxin [archaeon]|nr:type II toxin-antitoxin system HicB family antitoxin [archaeon]
MKTKVKTKAKVLEYDVMVFKDKQSGTYWGKVPALPGCYSQGDTEEELLEHMKEAIECHLGAIREGNKKIQAGVVGIRKVAVHAKT